MSRHDIGIAVLQWAAIRDPRAGEVTMTSPYLDHIRSTRESIQQLILTREIELAKTTTAEQQVRVERDLIFLRDELTRIDTRQVERPTGCDWGVAPR